MHENNSPTIVELREYIKYAQSKPPVKLLSKKITFI